MKKKIYIFISIVFFTLVFTPLVNIWLDAKSLKDGTKSLWNKAFLYNIDYALPVLGRVYSYLGVSINPGQVVLGKDGWFFLGDDHAQSITVKRTGVTDENSLVVQQVISNQENWEHWFHRHGVKQYRILIGPDKDSVYPEFLPDWAVHSTHQVLSKLLNDSPSLLYVDAITPLLAAKKNQSVPLYFKTDTHWNSLGAWIAFEAFAANLHKSEPGLRWPEPSLGKVMTSHDREGGDLSRFQRIQSVTRDREVALAFHAGPQLDVEEYDYTSGLLVRSGPNTPLDAPQKPLLVSTKGALNDAKVLWLRDSFGISLSPFMAATFSKTLQIHYDQVSSDKLVELVNEFKPDYVVFSAVERVSRMGLFLASPPTFSIANDRKQFLQLASGKASQTNDLNQAALNGEYKVTGADPYVVFQFSKPLQSDNVRQLAFNLSCVSTSDTVFPVQVYWSTKDKGFNEEDSAIFNVKQGTTAVDISSAKKWPVGKELSEIRFDLVAPKGCPVFSIDDLAVGTNP
ncbi:alginate O-acetyltransferase AlgX-related protein [Pseudomonas sp. TNT2022 ID642]|uniref:alginate O-acetyltransferase AlgX-related protein n=1 Tax=Pseudomonas sp. TNT2022 ID642 TaxID=2942632 RepID=UPI002362580D|nr:hypothetical protein [Pseudomonas sp. TNT2022 ID642]MDD1005300.1 hypothetical protein [Pseudomonas sp. TNT2022 ID642]